MYCVKKMTEDLYWVGGNDRRLALFENVYPIPRGVSYNAYVVLDEKTVLLDTVDHSVSPIFFENLAHVLNGRKLDYLIVNHMEPDHAATIEAVVLRYPEVTLVCNKKTAQMMKNFFSFDVDSRVHLVAEMDTLCTGKHTFAFVMAPMVHWPEVMVTYDVTTKTLFAADAFGTFGALGGNLYADEVNFQTEWLDDARRYYTNIVGKYGTQVQALLKKAATIEIAHRLKKKQSVRTMTDIPGTGYITREPETCAFDHITLPSFEDVRDDKRLYAEATRTEYAEHDPIRGRAMIQPCEGRYLVINPPAMPLDTKELDRVAELPYTREWHPMYEPLGGVPAIEEVRFSVIHNRGCFGGCNFCALAFHQGRMITSRSHASVIREVEAMTHHPLWKGYVSDVGGPSANFRHPSCRQQLERGMCPNRLCLAPTPCPNIDADHSDYLALLRKLRQIPGVKKVFVRSGIRYDYMLCDDNDAFFRELVRYHISGQLKVAPEHCIDTVLDYMGKPHIGTYERFMDEYRQLNNKYDKEQYVVPYLMSSHPGSTLSDAVALAEYLNRRGRQPEQVQDFYPTPGTISTCMYHTGIDPRTMQPVYVAKTPHEKDMQRALLQWRRPDKRRLVIQALHEAGREDLIGFGKECLVRPMTDRRKPTKPTEPQPPQRKYGKVYGGGKKPASARSAQNAKSGKSAKPGRVGKPAASGKSGRGDGVVRRAEGPTGQQGVPGVRQPRHGPNARDS